MLPGRSKLTEIPLGFPGNIFRSPMPFSRYDQNGQVWREYIEQNVSLVVILAETEEFLDQAKVDLPNFYRTKGIDVLHFPIPDFSIPGDEDAMDKALAWVGDSARRGINIAIHCMAGVGRTGLFLACMGKRKLGFDGQDAMDWIRSYIPGALESVDQEKYLFSF